MEKLTVIKVQDPLRQQKDVSVVDYSYESLLALRNKYFPADLSVVVSVNGKIIPGKEIGDTYPRANDYVLFVPEFIGGGGGDDGKSILGAVLMVALVVAMPAAISGLGAMQMGASFSAGFSGYFTGAYTLTTLGVIASAVGVAAGGMLISSLVTPDMPTLDTPTMGDDVFKSSTYAFSPRNTQEQGLVIPKFYGLNRLYGNIIATHNESIDHDNYQHLLIALGQGPIKRLFEYRINDQPLYDSATGVGLKEVDAYARTGKITQDIIPNFNDTKISFTPQQKVSHGSPVTYETDGDSFDKLEVVLSAPQGIWYANDQGGLSSHTFKVRVEIRKKGEVDWIGISDSTVTNQVGTEEVGHWTYKIEREYGRVWVFDDNISEDPNAYSEGEFAKWGSYGSEWCRYYYHWIHEGSRPIYADVSADYTELTSNEQSSFTKTFYGHIETQGTYDIRVTKLDGDFSSSRYGDDIYLSTVREVVEDDFTYPRTALLGIKALATDQLSGSLKVECMAECSYINVYDGSQWNNEVSDNPAWVVWDILTQPLITDAAIGKSNINTTAGVGNDIVRYDGKDPSLLDLTKFKEWADYCDEILSTTSLSGTLSSNGAVRGSATYFTSELHEGDYIKHATKGTRKVVQIVSDTELYVDYGFDTDLAGDSLDKVEKRCTFNGGFDTGQDLWSAALKVAKIARAAIVLNGTKFTVAIDKSIDGDATQPVQLFSAGNIYKDTFKETFISQEDRASEIEVDFINRNKDFTRDQFSIFNTGIDNPTSKASVQLFGVTSPEQAWREAMFRLYQNQYVERTIEFEADVDAIACTVGDCIYFAHEVPQWGYSGRIVSATSNTVTLDREVTIEAATDYEIMIRLTDDTLVTKTLTEMKNNPGDYSVLTLNDGDTFSETPVQYDVYTFGQIDVSKKIFRIIDMSRSQDLRRVITAVEYTENIYNIDSDTPITPPLDYSALKGIQPVSDLELVERAELNESDNLIRSIDVYFDIPSQEIYKEAEVWFRESPSGTWKLSGKTPEEYHRISPVNENTEYEVMVKSVGSLGGKTTNNNSASDTITTGTEGDFYNDAFNEGIKGLEIFEQANDTEFTGKHCKFFWNDITASDNKYGAGEEPSGAGTGNINAWLKDYEVKIYDSTGTILRRTEYPSTNSYEYTYEKNSEDGGTSGAVRSFIIEVRARDRYYRVSPKASLSVSNPAPSVPENIALTGFIKSLTVNFDAATDNDLEGYIIYAKSGSDWAGNPSESDIIYKGKGNTFLYECAGGTWYIKVAAYDKFGTDSLNYSSSSSVEVATADPLDTVAPAVPTGLGLSSDIDENAQTDSAYITASWDANSEEDFAFYELQIRKTGESDYSSYRTDETSFKFAGLPTGVTYYVRIRAVDMWSNQSTWTSESSQSTSQDSSAPGTPQNLSVTAGLKKVIISFDKNTENDLAGYEVHVSESDGFTPDASTLVNSGMDTLVGYDGSPDTLYYVKVRAFDWSGNYSGYTAQGSATTALADTDDIAAGAITSDKVTTGELITLSAQIADAIITNAKINTLDASKITAGTIGAEIINLGDSSFKLDGGNKLMTIEDSQVSPVERVKIGKLGVDDDDYGIQVYDSSGNLILGNGGLGNDVVDTIQIQDLAVTDAKINSLTADKLTAGEIDADVIDVTNLNADEISTGELRGINVAASSHVTKGSYLTSSLSGGESTVNVKNTTDFESGGGTAFIIDSTNDEDEITYTGKTATTLTGCSGVLAHSDKAVIVPAEQTIVMCDITNELRFFADRGDGTVAELANIGLNSLPSGGTGVIRVQNITNTHGVYSESVGGMGMKGKSSSSYGVYGISSSLSGVLGHSDTGNGVVGTGGNRGVIGYGLGASSGARGVVGSADDSSSWDFYASGNGTNYGPFTGGHQGLVHKNFTFNKGDVVTDKKIISKSNISNCIAINELSVRSKQSNVVGVVTAKGPLDAKNPPSSLINWEKTSSANELHYEAQRKQNKDDMGSPSPPILVNQWGDLKKKYCTINFNALGEGQVNVCKEGGDIEIGDYICSSSTPGKGMKQDDNIYRNYTVAKAREAVTWEKNDESIKQIACIYLCG